MDSYLITLFSPSSCPIMPWWIHEIIVIILLIATSHSAEIGTDQIVMMVSQKPATCKAYVWHLTQLICKFGCHIMQPICHTILSAEWQQTVCSHSICDVNILSKWQQAHLMCTLVIVQCSWLLKLHWLPIVATITVRAPLN